MSQPGPAWNDLLAQLPDPHLLQTWQWGEVKHAYGWQPLPQSWRDAEGKLLGAGLVLQRTVSPLRLKVLYVPRGPVIDWQNAAVSQKALQELESLARAQKAIFIKIDPEVLVGTGVPGREDAVEASTGGQLLAELKQRGWMFSREQVQFRNTVLMDLREPEEAWLARLKQKARYNLRLGEKRGVSVRVGGISDLPNLYHMYAETSVRDGFLIRSRDYYDTLWRTYIEAGMLEPLIAEVAGEAVAAIMVFTFGRRAWYLQGMSREAHRDKMPNYLLQWTALRRARERGCTAYDLWGAPNRFDETDPLWGVFRFKEALGGQVVRTIGAWDYPAQPLLYQAYTRVLPKILAVMRQRGRAETRQEVTG